MTSSKIFLYFLLSFIGGVFVSSFLEIPKLIIYELFILGAFYFTLGRLLALSKQPPKQQAFFKKALIVFAICLIILASGILRTSKKAEVRLPPFSYTYEGEEVKSSFIEHKLSSFKQKLREVIEQNLSPPQSSILAAIILGDKQNISSEWQEKLNIAGVRHITAISGMHIVILSGILIWLGIFLGLYRGQVFYFAVALLWLFILLIGFQPSAVRAGMMGSVFLFCQKLGRQKAADRTLVLTAAIMLVFNPLLLSNVGFQLSFLAVLGIIYLMPFFQSLFQKIKFLKIFSLSELLAMTFSALIFTLPILIYNFGYMSMISPLTNLLIVPLLSYIMGLGLFFVLLGVIWQPIGWLLSLPVWLLTAYLTKVVDFFSKISWASLTLQISWPWLIVCYLILGYFVWHLKKKEQLKFLSY